MEVKMGSMHCEDGEIRGKLEMKMKYEEETELRLGLPGNNISGGYEHEVARKRGFSETVVDLKLNLSSAANTCKDPCPGDADPSDEKEKLKNSNGSNAKMNSLHSKDKATLLSSASATSNDPVKPPAKAQVVGWPPVRSFRKNMMAVQKNSTDEVEKGGASNGFFVKVSMDGAPYLRKVDLKMYKSYQELSEALCKMFSSFTIGSCESQGMKELMSSEKKLMDLLNGSDYVPTYEDKDGDWMLVGDVPWDMFVESCKRLRIMKGTEAIGLAPKAMEKCKSRS